MLKKLSSLNLKKVIPIAVVILIIAVVASRFIGRTSIPDGFSYGNGRLEATETAVSSKIQGKLLEVRYREGMDIKAGEIAAVIDAEDVKARLRAAEANLVKAKEMAKESREAAKAALSEQNLATVTFHRTEELIRKNFISGAQLDRDRTALQTANANLASAKNRIHEADAAVDAAAADVDTLQVNVDDTILKAPVDGRVLYRLAEPGEVIAAGGRVLSMLDLSDVFMYIYLNTADAGKLSMGDEARIILDSIPDTPIPAHIAYVSPKNQFTPKEVETREERAKFMFRVKLKVDREWLLKHADLAKPGMPGIGWVRTDANKPWPAELPTMTR